jgi:release factor glutamine methyltransferase
MRIRDLFNRFRRRLAAVCGGSALEETEQVFESLLECTRHDLYGRLDGPAPDDLWEKLRAVLDRRETDEPLAYILGKCFFHSRYFRVTPDVLIPRPETEVLVQRVLDTMPSRKPALFLDLCTGSGCIAAVLCGERPGWRGVGSISTNAL